MVLLTSLVTGSIPHTESPVITHTPGTESSRATPLGPPAMEMRACSRPVVSSRRTTTLSVRSATHTDPRPTATAAADLPILAVTRVLLDVGSIPNAEPGTIEEEPGPPAF